MTWCGSVFRAKLRAFDRSTVAISPRVRSILFQLCEAAALDDLVQEVFLRAWKGLPKFRQTAQFSTWLYRIAWNVASDQSANPPPRAGLTCKSWPTTPQLSILPPT